jgi:hypothetical protein
MRSPRGCSSALRVGWPGAQRAWRVLEMNHLSLVLRWWETEEGRGPAGCVWVLWSAGAWAGRWWGKAIWPTWVGRGRLQESGDGIVRRLAFHYVLLGVRGGGSSAEPRWGGAHGGGGLVGWGLGECAHGGAWLAVVGCRERNAA